ncbi:MAG: hypothetical protein JO104_12015 [Candidatus Eremiobacteraeota bacterium]|nr:hypothetical protein [Candidatus Eremiobacteraeota bacterium]
METEIRTKLSARLAERGLSLKSFDRGVLTLSYNPAADTATAEAEPITAEGLSEYAGAVVMAVPGIESMFPRLERIAVDFDGG